MVILTNAKRLSNRNVITWRTLKSVEEDLSGIVARAVRRGGRPVRRMWSGRAACQVYWLRFVLFVHI